MCNEVHNDISGTICNEVHNINDIINDELHQRNGVICNEVSH